MNLFVIRHGESEGDFLKLIEGRADFPLTRTGLKQADEVGKWLRDNYQIDLIYSSPLKRAKQTADVIAGYFGSSVQVLYDLISYDNGYIAGLSQAEADERYPEPDIKYPHSEIYGMESMINFRARVETALSKILYECNPNYSIAVVTHGGVINELYSAFLRLPVTSEIIFSSAPASINHWTYRGSKRKVIFSNMVLY